MARRRTRAHKKRKPVKRRRKKGRKLTWQQKVQRWPRTKCIVCGRPRAKHNVRHPFRTSKGRKRKTKRRSKKFVDRTHHVRAGGFNLGPPLKHRDISSDRKQTHVREYLFNWIGGGYNSVRAANLSEATRLAHKMSHETRGLRVKPGSVRISTEADRRMEDSVFV